MPTNEVKENKEIPTLAEMLYHHYPYDGLGFTIDALQQMRKSLSQFYPNSLEEEQDKMLQILKLEIIMKFCHYAENLAAVAITFNKKFDSSEEEMTALFEKIYEYQVPEVIDFYNQIPKCDLHFIAKFLGYPPIRLQNEKGKKKIQDSCEVAKKELEIIAKNYLEFRLLYNAYKHGYRVFPGKDQNKQDAFSFIDKGIQKITTADDKIFDEITRASRHIEKIFQLILNHSARAELEKRGERNIPLDLKFFVKEKGLPHDPNTVIMYSARGKNRERNIADREKVYKKFKQELEAKYLEKFVLFDLDSEKILGISETPDEAVKIMHESVSKGRKSIRKIGLDDKTGIDWY